MGITADEQDHSAPSNTARLGPASPTKQAETHEDQAETTSAPAQIMAEVGGGKEEAKRGAGLEAVSPVAVMVPYPSNPLAEKDLGAQAVPGDHFLLFIWYLEVE